MSFRNGYGASSKAEGGDVCHPTQGSSQTAETLSNIIPDFGFEPVSDPLLELVWVLYSPSMDAMSAWGDSHGAFIHVFREETHAWRELTNGTWALPPLADYRPTRVSIATVIEQIKTQRFARDGAPIRGYTWFPEDIEVPVEGA